MRAKNEGSMEWNALTRLSTFANEWRIGSFDVERGMKQRWAVEGDIEWGAA
jgi:hypothetical protein